MSGHQCHSSCLKLFRSLLKLTEPMGSVGKHDNYVKITFETSKYRAPITNNI